MRLLDGAVSPIGVVERQMLKAFTRGEHLGQWVAVLDQPTDGRYIAFMAWWGTSAFSGSNVIGRLFLLLISRNY
jgi:hypothetical protein